MKLKKYSIPLMGAIFLLLLMASAKGEPHAEMGNRIAGWNDNFHARDSTSHAVSNRPTVSSKTAESILAPKQQKDFTDRDDISSSRRSLHQNTDRDRDSAHRHRRTLFIYDDSYPFGYPYDNYLQYYSTAPVGNSSLSITDIVSMVSQGIPDDVIIGEIEKTNSVFHLTSEGVIYLKAHNVSNAVIDYMLGTATAAEPVY